MGPFFLGSDLIEPALRAPWLAEGVVAANASAGMWGSAVEAANQSTWIQTGRARIRCLTAQTSNALHGRVRSMGPQRSRRGPGR